MKPIAVFRHSPGEGPGYFATFVESRRLRWQLVEVDRGEPIPDDPNAFAGLCFMGGPMSVNDELPWIARELDLIRGAVAAGVPVIGHCLGAQLMSKALGATVGRNPVKEIGWGEVEVADAAVARDWFGDARGFLAYHWHGETFTLPDGAVRVLSSRWCANQGFALGPHLGMQCHVEMTESMVRTWCRGGADEIAQNPVPSVQGPVDMLAELEARVAALHAIADRLYAHWIAGFPIS